MLRTSALALLDFLFPKAESVYDLEALTTGELVRRLPQPKETENEIVAIFGYDDQRVREIIWEIKYRRNLTLVKKLTEILSDVLKQELAEKALTDNFINPLLVPLPISAERRAERGWNQTEIICEEILKLNSELLTYAPHLLEKDRHTISQTKTSSKRERLRNVEGSMRVTDLALAKGRNIVLLDDVSTTGATFAEARRALRAARAKKVLCIALAH